MRLVDTTGFPVRLRSAEAGEATVEFIAMTVLLLIPVAYFIFTMAAVQAAVFASDAATRVSGRILAENPTALEFAQMQVEQIFKDYNVQGRYTLQVACDREPCNSAEYVAVEVQTNVELPLLPDVLKSALNPTIPIISTVSVPVSRIELVHE